MSKWKRLVIENEKKHELDRNHLVHKHHNEETIKSKREVFTHVSQNANVASVEFHTKSYEFLQRSVRRKPFNVFGTHRHLNMLLPVDVQHLKIDFNSSEQVDEFYNKIKNAGFNIENAKRKELTVKISEHHLTPSVFQALNDMQLFSLNMKHSILRHLFGNRHSEEALKFRKEVFREEIQHTVNQESHPAAPSVVTENVPVQPEVEIREAATEANDEHQLAQEDQMLREAAEREVEMFANHEEEQRLQEAAQREAAMFANHDIEVPHLEAAQTIPVEAVAQVIPIEVHTEVTNREEVVPAHEEPKIEEAKVEEVVALTAAEEPKVEEAKVEEVIALTAAEETKVEEAKVEEVVALTAAEEPKVEEAKVEVVQPVANEVVASTEKKASPVSSPMLFARTATPPLAQPEAQAEDPILGPTGRFNFG